MLLPAPLFELTLKVLVFDYLHKLPGVIDSGLHRLAVHANEGICEDEIGFLVCSQVIVLLTQRHWGHFFLLVTGEYAQHVTLAHEVDFDLVVGRRFGAIERSMVGFLEDGHHC